MKTAHFDEPELPFSLQLEDAVIQRQFKDLHPALRMWINEETIRRIVEIERKEREKFNATKHWWQKKKHTHFMIDYTPRIFNMPPFIIPGYDQAEKIVEQRIKLHLKYEKLVKGQEDA